MKRRTVMLGAASLPIAGSVCAQNAPAKPRVVGLISPAPWQRPWLEPFFAGMRDLGWTQGKDFILEERASGPEASRAAGVAIELRSRGAEVLLTSTTNVAIEASRATPSLPIVMIASGYPVEVGLAASLAHPGGNVTGLSLYAGKEVFSKQVQLLTEARPGLRRIGVLWDYPPPDGPLGTREMQAAARAGGRAGALHAAARRRPAGGSDDARQGWYRYAVRHARIRESPACHVGRHQGPRRAS